MNHWDQFVKWLTGSEADARRLAERHMPKATIALPTEEAGDRNDPAEGLEIGGVVWPVDGGHGAISFLTSQCFYAFHDKKAKRVYMLDNITGVRHPHAVALIVGDNVHPQSNVGGKGLVVRTALFGTSGLYQNIFIPTEATQLKAHHEKPDPPSNSSQVHDEDGRQGGLHYLTRVRRIVTKLCLGATDKLTEVFAPMLNFTRNGDGTPAHGVATFRGSEAMLSHEAEGPLCPADDGAHIGGVMSDGRKLHSGGIDVSRALYGDTSAGIIFSPLQFIKDPWEPGSKDAFVGKVEFREDLKDNHANLCGKKARGKKKWMEWKPKASPSENPPPTLPPRPPPTTGPPPPIPPNIIPAMATIPQPPIIGHPTNSGPCEEEQPSTRGIARPDFDPPTGTGFEEARAVADAVGATTDEVWRRAVGMTQQEFFDLPRVSHDAAQGVAAQTLPAGISSNPIILQAYLRSNFVFAANGTVYGRRGFAPGFQTLMPGGLESNMTYKARHGTKLTQSHLLTRLLLNYKQGSNTVETLFAMGARLATADHVASGAELSLDHSVSADTPGLTMKFRDQNAALTTTPKFEIQGNLEVDEDVVVGGDVSIAGDLNADTLGVNSIEMPGAGGAYTFGVVGGVFQISYNGNPKLQIDGAGSAMTVGEEGDKVTVPGTFDPPGIIVDVVKSAPEVKDAALRRVKRDEQGVPVKEKRQRTRTIGGQSVTEEFDAFVMETVTKPANSMAAIVVLEDGRLAVSYKGKTRIVQFEEEITE